MNWTNLVSLAKIVVIKKNNEHDGCPMAVPGGTVSLRRLYLHTHTHTHEKNKTEKMLSVRAAVVCCNLCVCVCLCVCDERV
jgi:hypothetical protein